MAQSQVSVQVKSRYTLFTLKKARQVLILRLLLKGLPSKDSLLCLKCILSQKNYLNTIKKSCWKVMSWKLKNYVDIMMRYDMMRCLSDHVMDIWQDCQHLNIFISLVNSFWLLYLWPFLFYRMDKRGNTVQFHVRHFWFISLQCGTF